MRAAEAVAGWAVKEVEDGVEEGEVEDGVDGGGWWLTAGHLPVLDKA